MGSHSRTKGRSGEQEVVRLARAAGIEAVRTWQSAQGEDAAERRCDVRIAGHPCQVKRQADGFSWPWRSTQSHHPLARLQDSLWQFGLNIETGKRHD